MPERTLNWEDSKTLRNRVKKLGCSEPVATPLDDRPQKSPDPNQPATVMCGVKVRSEIEPCNCTAMDGSFCPLSFPVVNLEELGKDLG